MLNFIVIDVSTEKIAIYCRNDNTDDENKFVLAHQASIGKLMYFSGYFKTLLQSNFKEKNEKMIELEEEPSLLKIMLDHMELPSKMLDSSADGILDEILQLADKYDIPTLEKAIIVRYLQISPVPVDMFISLVGLAFANPQRIFWHSILKEDCKDRMAELKSNAQFHQLLSKDCPKYAIDLILHD